MITEPTKQLMAFYRAAGTRRDALSDAREWLDALPYGDLPIAERALAFIRATTRESARTLTNGDTETRLTKADLRYAAGRFYVLGQRNLWAADDSGSGQVVGMLQEWARNERRQFETHREALGAAHAAAERDDDEKFLDDHGAFIKRFRRFGGQWAVRTESSGQRERVMNELRGLTRIDSPEVFDADPDALTVANGVVNLRTGELRALRPNDYASQLIGVDYDPNAQAPTWQRFLREVLVTETGEPDVELIEWVRRLIGYGITGHARAQVFVNLLGGGSNGKSVFMETLADLFSAISRSAMMSTFEYRASGGASGDLARLAGARLVFASEGEAGARLSAATIKRITGEDTMVARFLYREEFEFRPRFLLMMASNTRAQVLDNSDGYWRRLRVVPFRRKFTLEERDETLKFRLRDEFPGILRWAVEGSQDWYAYGLGSTATIDEAVSEYRASQDRLGDFMTARLVLTDAPRDVLSYDEAWTAYVAWAEDTKSRDSIMKRHTFLEALGERITRAKSNGRRVFRGAKLLSEAEATTAARLATLVPRD